MAINNPYADPNYDGTNNSAANPYADPDYDGGQSAPKSGTIRRAIGDTALTALKSTIAVPEIAVGLADLVSGGRAGKFAEEAGFKPKQAKEFISDYYSPEQKLANQKVQEADGFIDTAKTALQYPSTIFHTTLESLGGMGVGGLGARGLMAVAPKVAPFVAGAIGEGLVTAGQNAEQLRQETDDGLLTGKQAAITAGSGALTGLISGASGSIAKKLGIADIDTLIAEGKLAGKATGLPKAIAGGVISEGLLEEMPQSAQEQIAQNLSLDKPWDESVGNAAAMGALSGGLMGGGANVLNAFGGKDNTQVTPPPAPPPAPEGSLTSAATIAQAVGLTPQPVTPDVTEAKPNIVDSLNAVEAQQNGVMPDTVIAPIEPATIAPEQAAEKQIIDEQAQQAATSPLNDLPQPTEAQKEAGNYKKAHLKYDGLNITVENPQGSTRSGVDEDGATWENTLAHHYGYIKRTKGNDGDNLDVFVGDKPANGKVFVINQTKKDGSFDEHKAVLGAETADEAIAIYKANYADDWNGGKSVTELTTPAFKDWLKNGDPTKPLETVSATSNDVDMTKVAVGEQVDVGGVPYVKTENGFERVEASERLPNASPEALPVNESGAITENPQSVQTSERSLNALPANETNPAIPATNQAIVGEDDLPFDAYAQKKVDDVNNVKAQWITAQPDTISARDIAFTDSDKLYEDIKQNRRGMTFEKATSLIDAAEKDAIVDSVIANKLRNDIAPLATTNNAEPAQPTDTVRPLVEQLTKLRATADKHPSFDPALKAAKDFMAGKKVSPKQFKNFANLLGKKNKAFREVLMQLHDQAATTPEQLAAKEKKSKLAKAMLEERMKLDTTKDGLMQAMAKLGGLNADKAKSEFGIDPADMRQHGAGIKRSFNKNGLDADTMRELLLEQGYPVGESVADLGNAIADAMSGIDVLTPAGQEALAQKKYEEYANGIDELSDDEQALLDELVTKATAKYGAEALAEIDASLAESMKGQPQPEIERALLRMLKEEFDDETGNAGNSQATEGQAGQDTETGSTETGSGRAPQDGANTESQGSDTSQDLLGDNTAAKQALADAERAKDAKRNSGNDNQDTFTLSGSDSEFEQARAAGAQDLIEASQAETPANQDEVVYNGVRLYKTKVRNKVEGQPPKEMWTVESDENKARRERGDRTIGGDTLTETLEEAKAEADFMLKRDAQNKQSQEAETKRAAEQAEKERKEAESKSNLDGFGSELDALNLGKVKETLNKPISIKGEVLPLRDMVRKLIAEGGKPEITQENVYKGMTRAQYNRADNRAQQDNDKKIREGGKKNVYNITMPDGGMFELGKIAHDFADYLISNKKSDVAETDFGNMESPAEQPKPETKPAEKVDDFGEKLEGARKDMVRAMAKEYSDDEIASLPLSKLWPADDVNLIENKLAAAIAHTARAMIPSKPRKYGIKKWVADVKMLRGIGRLVAEAMDRDATSLLQKIKDAKLGHFQSKVALLEAIDRENWKRIGRVEEYPHAYSYVDGVKQNQPLVRVDVDGRTNSFNAASVADVVDQVNEKLGVAPQDKRMAFEVRGRPGSYFINKKGDKNYTKLKEFTDTNPLAAFDFIKNNYDEVLAAWEATKDRLNVKESDVRGKTNKPRTGEDYRNGKDVTTEQFATTFGFRGVQFGEWVKQGGKDNDRQGALNAAYDALMDLANIVGVPPQALSLEGTLGLSFGARGHGKAAAHFEPSMLVINLTKTQGAGTLAHEWFHALDNYFSRKRGGEKTMADVRNSQQNYREANYITYKPEPLYVHKDHGGKGVTLGELQRRLQQNPSSGYFKADNWIKDPKHPEGVRPEVEERFAALVEALNVSPMKQRAMSIDTVKEGTDGYWSRIIERAARSFENYVIHKMQLNGYDNDYLANVVKVEGFGRDSSRFPYLLDEEIAPVAEAFDNLFNEIKTKETDKGIALFASRGNNTDFTAITLDTANTVVSRVLAANKKNWNINIIAVPTFDALPDDVKNTTTKQYGKDEAKNASGITHNGKVYVIADMNGSEQEAESIILHEVEGHIGIRRLYGTEINKKLNALYLSIGGLKGIKDIAKQRGITQELSNVARQLEKSSFSDDTRISVMMEEMLAYTAQNPKFSDRVKEIVGMIRAWLREHGFMKLAEYGETDLLNVLREGRSKLNAKVDADGNVISVMHNNRPNNQNTELTKLKENVIAAKRQFDKMTADRRAGNLTLEQYEEVLDGVINSEADLAKALVALPDEGFALQGKTRSGNTLILAPSVKNAGQWQLSRFDERGAYGDSERKTKLEAVKLLIEEADVSTITDYDVRFSRPSAPTFYSALAKAIPLAKQDTMPAGQWKNWLVANAGKMNVKQAELQWSGLTDWLDLQQGKVSKADIQQYLDANGVQVSETMLGDDNLSMLKPFTVEQNEDGWVVLDNNQANFPNGRIADGAFEEEWEAQNRAEILNDDLTDGEYTGFAGRAIHETKYSKYTVAGGDNYKELLLTLPEKENQAKAEKEANVRKWYTKILDLQEQWNNEKSPEKRIELRSQIRDAEFEYDQASNQVNPAAKYKSSHFDQSNILAHVRFDERVDADGNKVLFINEIQSDWAQQGRKDGFGEKLTYAITNENGDYAGVFPTLELAKKELIEVRDVKPDNTWDIVKTDEYSNAVPSAPFVADTKAWVSLAIKRMVRYAAENGFDKVAIINGQQAADLYDLSKQVSSIDAKLITDGRFVIYANKGDEQAFQKIVTRQELPDTVGKDLAEKIIADADSHRKGVEFNKKYSGLDLKVGGEGMLYFYNSLVPQVANDVLKKIGGGKVENVEIDTRKPEDNAYYEEITNEYINNQLGFTITPELRAKALEGLPLFSRPQSKFSQKSTGIDIRDLNAVVANVNQALRGLPATYVLEDYTKAPAELVADIKRDKAYDAAGAWHNGEIYLFRNNIINTNHALFTMLHESTHEGLRRVFGKEIDATLMGIYLSNKDIKQQADSLRATHKDLSLVASVEEALADMGGNGIKASVMDKLVAFVRNFLRRLGMNLTVSDGEVRTLVTRALDSLKSPSKVTHYTIGSAYARNENTKTEYENRIDELFNNSRVEFGKLGVKILDRSDILDLLGYGDKPIYLNEKKVIDGLSFHNLKAEHWKKIPEWLDNPALVFESDTVTGRLVVIAPEKLNNTPIRIVLDPDGSVGGLKVNLVVNAYDAKGANPFARWINEGLLRYYNKTKSPVVLARSELQLLGMAKPRGTGVKILRDSDLVKYRAENNDTRYSRPTPRLSPVVQPATPNQQWQSPDKSKLDNVIYMLQNKFVDLKRVTQAIQKSGNTIEDRWNPYLLEENFTGRTAKRTKDFLKQELEPLMKSMQARKVEMADFEEYLWARHAEERNIQIAKINPAMQDGGSGMKTQDARDYLANLTPVQAANYQALAAKVDAILKTSRQRLISYGLETPETIAAWEGAYQHYVPLMREDMDNGFGNGSGQGFSVKGNASKRATGSQRAVVDVLANIAQQVERNIIRGEKNRVSTALVGLATLNPNKDFWKVDVVPKMRTVVAGKNTYEVLYNGSVVQTFTNPVEANKFIQWNGAGYTLNIVKGQDLVMDVPDPSYKNRDNIVVARIVNAKGKIEEHFVEFNTHDERAMRAAASIKNLDQDQIGELLGTASSITRYFSSINTQYNPFFGVINILRDVQGSLLNLSSTPLAGKQLDVLKNTPLALKGIYQDIRSERKTGTPTNSFWSLLFEDFQKQGGQTGYRDMYRNAKERGEALKHALDPTWWQQTTAGKIVTINGILAKPEQFLKEAGQKYIFDWLSDYNESMENAVRLSAYKVALDNGMSKAQAASLAKNISVNFNRKGEMGRQIGSLYAFFNASVQGTARIGETLFTDDNGKLTLSKAGKAIVTGGLLLGVMQALMLAAAGFGDDEPPEFVRDRNLIIPLGNGKAITIAMPLGFNALPAFGRILTEWALSGGEDTSKRFVHIFDMLAEVTNPIGSAGLSMQTLVPTMLDPLAALAENKDWTGRPIAKMDFNSQKPTAGHTRAKDTASAISKGLSWVVNEATGGSDYTPGALSPTPDQIDYLLGQIFGGVGREYMKLEQSATSIVTGEDLPVYKIPLVGRFYLDAEGQSSQSSRFYDNLKSVFETETELKGLRKDGLDTSEYRANHPEAALVFRANLEQREISKMYKLRSEKLKADASPEEIKALNERITARMLKFNELFKTRTTAGE